MFILTHSKTEDGVHELTINGFNGTNLNFIVETEFNATADYIIGDTFKVNGTAFTAELNPNVHFAFSANSVVHCILDFKRKHLIVLNMHKAKYDSLWIYNAAEQDVTDESAPGTAMADNKNTVSAPLFFGFGENNDSVMHSAIIGYTFSTKDLWETDDDASESDYTIEDEYGFYVTIDLGSENGFPSRTFHHVITRKCEIVSNEFTLDNIPSGDTVITVTLDHVKATKKIIRNSFTIFVQCPDMSFKKDIPIIYYPVPNKDDECYMLGWSDVSEKRMNVPNIVPRTPYKVIGMISPRFLSYDPYAVMDIENEARKYMTPEDITMLNNYNQYLTYGMLCAGYSSSLFKDLQCINFGSEFRFLFTWCNDMTHIQTLGKDKSFTGFTYPYINFNGCKNLSYVEYYNGASPGSTMIHPEGYPLTSDNCVDKVYNADPNRMLFFDGHVSSWYISTSYSMYYNYNSDYYAFGLDAGYYCHDDNYSLTSFFSNKDYKLSNPKLCRLVDITITDCVCTNWPTGTFRYKCPKNIKCDAKFILAGANATAAHGGARYAYKYDATATTWYTSYNSSDNTGSGSRFLYGQKRGILSSEYHPEDLFMDSNAGSQYNREYTEFPSNAQSRIDEVFRCQPANMYIHYPSATPEGMELATNIPTRDMETLTEEERTKCSFEIKTLLTYRAPYFAWSNSDSYYYGGAWASVDIKGKGILAWEAVQLPADYAKRHLRKFFQTKISKVAKSSTSFVGNLNINRLGRPLSRCVLAADTHVSNTPSDHTSNVWECSGAADRCTSSDYTIYDWYEFSNNSPSNSYSYWSNYHGYTTLINANYGEYSTYNGDSLRFHIALDYVYAPCMTVVPFNYFPAAFSSRFPKLAIGDGYLIEIAGDCICNGGIISGRTPSQENSCIEAGTTATHNKPRMYHYYGDNSSNKDYTTYDVDTVKIGGMFSLIGQHACRFQRNASYIDSGTYYNKIWTYDASNTYSNHVGFRPRYEINILGTIPPIGMIRPGIQQWVGNNYSEIIHGNMKINSIQPGAIFGTAAFQGTFWDPSNSTLDISNVGAIGASAFVWNVGIDEITYPDEDHPIEAMASTWFEGMIGTSYREALIAELAKDESEQQFRNFNFNTSCGFIQFLRDYSSSYALARSSSSCPWKPGMTTSWADGRFILQNIHFDHTFKYVCRVISTLQPVWYDFKPLTTYEKRSDINALARYIYGTYEKTVNGASVPTSRFLNSEVSAEGGLCHGLDDFDLADHSIMYIRAMHDSDIGDTPLVTSDGISIATVPELWTKGILSDIDAANTSYCPIDDRLLQNFYGTSTNAIYYINHLSHWISYMAVSEQILRVKEGTLTADKVAFPKVEICDTVEVIGQYFLANFPVYYDPAHPEDFEWREIHLENVRYLGDYAFSFIYFTDKTDPMKSYMAGKNNIGLVYNDEAKALFENNLPIKKIYFGDNLEAIPKGLDGITLIIPETNPHFKSADGYTYNAEQTIMISANMDIINATTDADDPITIPDTVETICCWSAMVKDRRIRELAFHGAKLDIVDTYGDATTDTSIHAAYASFGTFPVNLKRIEVTGNTNIPFDNASIYPDDSTWSQKFYVKLYGTGTGDLDTNTSHRFYTKDGCTCGEIFMKQTQYTPEMYLDNTYYSQNAVGQKGYVFNHATKWSWHHYAPSNSTVKSHGVAVQPSDRNPDAALGATDWIPYKVASATLESLIYTNAVNDDPLIDTVIVNATPTLYHIFSPHYIDTVNVIKSGSTTRGQNDPLYVNSDFNTFATGASMYYVAKDPDSQGRTILYGKNGTSDSTAPASIVRIPPEYDIKDLSIPSSLTLRPGALFGCSFDNLTLEHSSYRWYCDAYDNKNSGTSQTNSKTSEERLDGSYTVDSADALEFLDPNQGSTSSSTSSMKLRPANKYWGFSGVTVENLHINIAAADYDAFIHGILHYLNGSSNYWIGFCWQQNYNMWIDSAIYDTVNDTPYRNGGTATTYPIIPYSTRENALAARTHIAHIWVDNTLFTNSYRNATRTVKIDRIMYGSLATFHNHPSEELTHIHFPADTDILEVGVSGLEYFYVEDGPNILANCKTYLTNATRGAENIPVFDFTTYDGYTVRSGNNLPIMVANDDITITNCYFDSLDFGENCIGNDITITNSTIKAFPSVKDQGIITVDKVYDFIRLNEESDFDKYVFSGGFGDSIGDSIFGTATMKLNGYVDDGTGTSTYAFKDRLAMYIDNFHASDPDLVVGILNGAKHIGEYNRFGITLNETTRPLITVTDETDWVNVASTRQCITAYNYNLLAGVDSNGYVLIKDLDDPSQIYPVDDGTEGYTGTPNDAFGSYTTYQKLAILLNNGYYQSSMWSSSGWSSTGYQNYLATKFKYNPWPEWSTSNPEEYESYYYDITDPVLKFMRKGYGLGIEVNVNVSNNSTSQVPNNLGHIASVYNINSYFKGYVTPKFRYGTTFKYDTPTAYVYIHNDNNSGNPFYTNATARTGYVSTTVEILRELHPEWSFDDLIDASCSIILANRGQSSEIGYIKGIEFSANVQTIHIYSIKGCLGDNKLEIGTDGRPVYFVGSHNNVGIGYGDPMGQGEVEIRNVELRRPSSWGTNTYFSAGYFTNSAAKKITIGLSTDAVSFVNSYWSNMRNISAASSAVSAMGYKAGDYQPFYNAFYYVVNCEEIDLTNVPYIFSSMFYYFGYSGSGGNAIKTIKSDAPIKGIARNAFYYARGPKDKHDLSLLLEKGTGSVQYVGYYAFYNSDMYMTDMTSVTTIEQNAFYYCKWPAGTELYFPALRSTPGSSAFYGSSGVTKVHLSKSYTGSTASGYWPSGATIVKDL